MPLAGRRRRTSISCVQIYTRIYTNTSVTRILYVTHAPLRAQPETSYYPGDSFIPRAENAHPSMAKQTRLLRVSERRTRAMITTPRDTESFEISPFSHPFRTAASTQFPRNNSTVYALYYNIIIIICARNIFLIL